MGDITKASQEQSDGIEQTNSTIVQTHEVTQQNAALVEQASAATASVEQLTGVLMQQLSVFKLAGRVDLAAGRPG
jgi:methyl-accepting chemotaxis protein